MRSATSWAATDAEPDLSIAERDAWVEAGEVGFRLGLVVVTFVMIPVCVYLAWALTGPYARAVHGIADALCATLRRWRRVAPPPQSAAASY